jgi:3-hydroxyacyl-CoA dehydrogenase
MITSCTNCPQRVLVGHPFNPPHLIPLVEVVPHPETDPVITATTMSFYKSLGRKPIEVSAEVPGFVANRLQAALMAEAFSLVTRGIVTAEAIGKLPATCSPIMIFCI